ncbi:polyketide cyclase / dehydrase and lipid transport [Pedococcus dokdonensis]|uniref:polyketide cyclase / dehydrase and lipid transport n=1 Tax=Pedococcus dokdonensis TaxID=443156 RepID=UPI0012FD8A4D|nr:polyketide cyclase / dehydrase and lipid transport [Pedococcus dokdonensis]
MRDRRIDIVDETFIRARPEVVRATFDDRTWTSQVWPHLAAAVQRDRGVKGVRWAVTGQVMGEMEVWLEPFRDGVVVHHYVRGTRGPHAPRDVAIRHTLRWKKAVHALKDRLEGGAGGPSPDGAGGPSPGDAGGPSPGGAGGPSPGGAAL